MSMFRKSPLAVTTPPPQPAALDPDAPDSWILLSPGRHIVDGKVVDVAPSVQTLVPYAVKAGRHIVDGKIVIAPVLSHSLPR